MATGISQGLSQNGFQTALDKVFYAAYGYNDLPGVAHATTPSVFMQSTTGRSAVIVEQNAGPGYFEERAEQEDIALSSPRLGNQITFRVRDFDKGFNISKKAFDDDLHDMVRKNATQLGINARLTQDKEAFAVLNNGFTTTLSGDGVSVFNNAHPLLNGGTVDNLETGVLTEANLDTLVQKLRTQETQDGTLAGHSPSVLLVPTGLFKPATEITKSEMRSGTADNDGNYFSMVYPGLQVFSSPFLDAAQGGSDTAYFLMSQQHSLYRWVRSGLETYLVDWKTQTNKNYRYIAGYREVVGAISFEGLVASDGTV